MLIQAGEERIENQSEVMFMLLAVSGSEREEENGTEKDISDTE